MCVYVCVFSFRAARPVVDFIQQSPFEGETRKHSSFFLPNQTDCRAAGREGIYKLFSHFHTVSSIPNGGTNSVFVRDPWLLGLSGFHGNHKAHWKEGWREGGSGEGESLVTSSWGGSFLPRQRGGPKAGGGGVTKDNLSSLSCGFNGVSGPREES